MLKTPLSIPDCGVWSFYRAAPGDDHLLAAIAVRSAKMPHMKTITPLRAWMAAATVAEQELLAQRVGTSRAYLYQLAGGHRSASAERNACYIAGYIAALEDAHLFKFEQKTARRDGQLTERG